MEHFITGIRIDELRHLSDIMISLNTDSRQHLIITGKNGSGKTSLLWALKNYLCAINEGELCNLCLTYIPNLLLLDRELKEAQTNDEKTQIKERFQDSVLMVKQYKDGVEPIFNNWEDLDELYVQGNFITAFFPANRKTQFVRAKGVEDVRLEDSYGIHGGPGYLLHKYMVHLKTQQAYARNEGDTDNVERIQKWFERFVDALRILLDDVSLFLEYDYKEYDFKIHEKGKLPFRFDELSDGYSSVVDIVSDLILRMDKNWILGEGISEYNDEGVVLIDELETHLHIELQKKILPFLTTFFPRIQFIVTTHSPYILNSISNAKAYDLENCMELENLSLFSADGLAQMNMCNEA